MDLLPIIRADKADPNVLNGTVKNLMFGDSWKSEDALKRMDFCAKGSKDYTYLIDKVCELRGLTLGFGSINENKFIGVVRQGSKLLVQTEIQPTVGQAATMAFLMLVHLQSKCGCGHHPEIKCDITHHKIKVHWP